MPRPARGGVCGDGQRRRYGLLAGSGRILDEGMRTPLRNLLPSVSRLCNVIPMPRDYYLLSPSDPPQQTAPQKQGSLPQETEAPPAGERRRELPMPPVVYVPCIPGDDGISHLSYRNLDDGRVALLVYTALDRLIDLAGDVHWALLDWDALQQAQDLQHYDIILQDVRIPEDRR